MKLNGPNIEMVQTETLQPQFQNIKNVLELKLQYSQF